MSSEAIDRAEYERDAVARAKILGGKIPFTKGRSAKFWATPLEERLGAKPIDEREWFKIHQPLLLEMANTDEGRELFGIPAEYGKIEKFAKHVVAWKTGAFWINDDGFIQEEWKADFRIGAKWGNVIRYRWREFCKLAKTFYEREYKGLKIYRPVLRVEGELVAARLTDTSYPDPSDGATTIDGTLRHSTNLGSSAPATQGQWDTTHDAANATNVYETSSPDYLCDADDWFYGSNYYLDIRRGIAMFQTGDTIDGGTVTESIASWYIDDTFDADSEDEAYIGLVESDPADVNQLVAGDYQKIGLDAEGDFSLNSAIELTDSGDRYVMADDNGTRAEDGQGAPDAYRNWNMNSAGHAAIATASSGEASITKLGLRHGHDIADHPTENTPSASAAASMYSYIYGKTADHTSTGSDPKLEVTYTAVTTDIHALNGVAYASIQAVNGITAANGEAINGVDF